MSETLRKGQVVRDEQGNHFLVIQVHDNAPITLESVATRELFTVHRGELFPTDREAF